MVFYRGYFKMEQPQTFNAKLPPAQENKRIINKKNKVVQPARAQKRENT